MFRQLWMTTQKVWTTLAFPGALNERSRRRGAPVSADKEDKVQCRSASMLSNVDHGRRSLLDAARAVPARRERQRLFLTGSGYSLLFIVSVCELYTQSLTRRLVEGPEWWFVWLVFGSLSLLSAVRAVSRLLVASSLTPLPGWSADALARLPPRVAFLAGLPPTPAGTSRRRGFALGGGMFLGGHGGDIRDGTEMTTPEVLRSTSLRNRSAVRSGPLAQQGTPGGASGATPGRSGSERRLFSPQETPTKGKMRPLTPLERAKAGRRALAVRPEDIPRLMEDYDKRHTKPKGPDPAALQSNALDFVGSAFGYEHGAGGGGGGGYYGQGGGDASAWGGGAVTPLYQSYEPGETEVANRAGRDADRDKAEQRLVKLGIAQRTDEFTKNVKTYVVRLMRQYLDQLDQVCYELHERGVAEELLRQQVQRQPELRVRNTPRAFVNFSLKDMAVQFGQQPEFLVQGPDGQAVSLFQRYQHLEEALHVTAGSGAAGVGNPAYVLERLRVLAEDDFMSAFVYDKGGGYPAHSRDWTEDLPTDAAIVMRLFVCCADNWLPRQWEQDRPFARQHFVDRQPCNRDALPGRYFLTRNDPVHPPHFFVVANEEVWHALPGPTNVFQAIALFLYAIKTNKSGYLGTGISIAKVLTEIFH